MQRIFGGRGIGAVRCTESSGSSWREEDVLSNPSTRFCSFSPAAMNDTASKKPAFVSGKTRSSRRSPAALLPLLRKLISRITIFKLWAINALMSAEFEVVEQKRGTSGKRQ